MILDGYENGIVFENHISIEDLKLEKFFPKTFISLTLLSKKILEKLIFLLKLEFGLKEFPVDFTYISVS